MLKELFSLFTANTQDDQVAGDLDRMIELCFEILRSAGDRCFARKDESPGIETIREGDKEINRLQRSIRKNTFLEMAGDSQRFSLAFGVSMMNIVKDVERIGDYAKDLANLTELQGPLQPSRSAAAELGRLATSVEDLVEALPGAMKESDQVRAVHLIDRGKEIRSELRSLQKGLLAEQQADPRAPVETLATQYYIRIVSHALNVLSTLVTPLHRMDYVRKKHLLPEVKDKLKEASQTSEV